MWCSPVYYARGEGGEWKGKKVYFLLQKCLVGERGFEVWSAGNVWRILLRSLTLGASGLVSEPVVETLLTLTVLLFLSPGGRGAGGTRRERGGERNKEGWAEIGWKAKSRVERGEGYGYEKRRVERVENEGRRGGSEKRKERSIVAVVKWEESNHVPSCTNYTINLPLNSLSIRQLTAAHRHT